MRILSILIVYFSFTLSAFGQNLSDGGFTNREGATNRIVNGIKEGKWIEYRYSDNMVELTTDTNAPYYSLSIYKGGKPYGMVRVYYKSGKLKSEIPYDTNGIKNGVEKEFYESGKTMYEEPRVNDRTNGIFKEYYESGQLEIEASYDTNGIENGLEKQYYESGKIKSETLYKKGIEKRTKNYDENGKEIK